jgi:hypothetical protein
MRIWIRILLLVKGMQTYDRWSTDPHGSILILQGLHYKRPRLSWLHFKPLKLLNFSFMRIRILNPDPAFHSNADRDPKIIRIHADRTRSITLLKRICT